MTLTFDKPAAILEGGPRDGWGYFLDDLEVQIRACENRGVEFDYRPTERRARHPLTGVPGILSDVWEYVEPEVVKPKRARRKAPEPPMASLEPAPAEVSVLEQVRAAIELHGRRGAQLSTIAKDTGHGATQLAPLVWWLTHTGVAEASPGLFDDTFYRLRQ